MKNPRIPSECKALMHTIDALLIVSFVVAFWLFGALLAVATITGLTLLTAIVLMTWEIELYQRLQASNMRAMVR